MAKKVNVGELSELNFIQDYSPRNLTNKAPPLFNKKINIHQIG